MATYPMPLRRLILACGFAVAAVAAPAITAITAPMPTGPATACASGEESDLYTGNCVPHTVPNSRGAFSAIPGNPNLPAVNLPGGGGAIPCTGANTGECIGLAEEAQSEGPQAVPRSTIGSSPTVTGHIG